MEQFPNNSDAMKAKQEKEHLKPVVSGTIKEHKSLGIVSKTVGEIGTYILHDVLKPALKKTMYEMISGSARIAFMDGIEPTSQNSRGTSIIRSYDRIYDSVNSNNSSRSSNSVGASRSGIDIQLKSRAECERLRSDMEAIIDRQDHITVSQLRDLIHDTNPSDYTEENWGWFSIATATTRSTNDGFVLCLPPAKAITR